MKYNEIKNINIFALIIEWVVLKEYPQRLKMHFIVIEKKQKDAIKEINEFVIFW